MAEDCEVLRWARAKYAEAFEMRPRELELHHQARIVFAQLLFYCLGLRASQYFRVFISA